MARLNLGSGRSAVAPYAVTIFLSAFLVLQVQPIIAKFILPWFGGGSAVWTATQLFFQIALLGGYAYAHLVSSRLTPKRQGGVHLILLITALAVLPIIPDKIWQPDSDVDPTLRIVALLAVTVGAPYLLLSTTGPLVQQWFAREHPGRNPYVLYALSNAGSLIGLLAYPLVVERFVGLTGQAWTWSAGYVVFAALCGYLAWRSRTTAPAPIEATDTPDAGAQPVGIANVVLWAALPACAVVLLLAVTTQITQDVAAMPLLWVLPLSIYLFTFILCFSGDRWYEPQTYGIGLAIALGMGWWVLDNVIIAIAVQIAVYSFLLFFGCMALHGELTRVRPAARHLTAYYLLISTGGALGGVFVALIAPRVFDGYWEYHVALIGAGALAVIARGLDEWRRRKAGRRTSLDLVPSVPGLRAAVGVASIVGVVVLSFALWRQVESRYRGIEVMGRNFYGSVRIYQAYIGDPQLQQRVMEHGRILHGFQFVSPERRAARTGYYGRLSGAGLAINERRATLDRPMRIGVLGLGAGMLAAYGQRGDTVDIYEINPMVLDLAESPFTYLADARARGANVEVYIGDGRLVLEQQLEAGSKQFDVLLLDAFSSDSVPVHLLTAQAFDIYKRHLAPGGVIAANISNRHVDLRPVLRGVGAKKGLEVAWVQGYPDTFEGYFQTDWVLLGDRAFLDRTQIASATGQWNEKKPILWTDDRSNLFSILRFR